MKTLKDPAEDKSIKLTAESEFSGAVFQEKFPAYVKLMHQDRDSLFEEHFQVRTTFLHCFNSLCSPSPGYQKDHVPLLRSSRIPQRTDLRIFAHVCICMLAI